VYPPRGIARWVYRIDRVTSAVTIQVRVAGGDTYRVFLQPPGGAGSILPELSRSKRV